MLHSQSFEIFLFRFFLLFFPFFYLFYFFSQKKPNITKKDMEVQNKCRNSQSNRKSYLDLFIYLFVCLLTFPNNFLSFSRLVWPGLVLWHINHCRLLHAKSIFIYINISISRTFVKHVVLMSRVFANGSRDPISIPGRIIPKTLKMVLDPALFNCHLRIKGGVIKAME